MDEHRAAPAHKPGEMATLWMDPKETKGPNDPDRVPAGEIPQVPRDLSST